MHYTKSIKSCVKELESYAYVDIRFELDMLEEVKSISFSHPANLRKFVINKQEYDVSHHSPIELQRLNTDLTNKTICITLYFAKNISYKTKKYLHVEYTENCGCCSDSFSELIEDEENIEDLKEIYTETYDNLSGFIEKTKYKIEIPEILLNIYTLEEEHLAKNPQLVYNPNNWM